MTDVPFLPGEDFAIAMDERDQLKDFRGRFLFPKTSGRLRLSERSLARAAAEDRGSLR